MVIIKDNLRMHPVRCNADGSMDECELAEATAIGVYSIGSDGLLTHLVDYPLPVKETPVPPVGCPECQADSDSVEYGSIQVDCTVAWQECSCNCCGHEWHEVYEYVGVQ